MGERRRTQFGAHALSVAEALKKAVADVRSPQVLAALDLSVKADGQFRGVLDLLGHDHDPNAVLCAFSWLSELPARTLEQVEIEARYRGYLPRQRSEARQLQAQDAVALPDGLDYAAIGGLSTEMRERLIAARPSSFGALTRVPGMTPPAIIAVISHVRARQERCFT